MGLDKVVQYSSPLVGRIFGIKGFNIGTSSMGLDKVVHCFGPLVGRFLQKKGFRYEGGQSGQYTFGAVFGKERVQEWRWTKWSVHFWGDFCEKKASGMGVDKVVR